MPRQVSRTRPQLLCILADNGPAMSADSKAPIVTEAIRDMLMECQTRGPRGRDRSYFRLLLIRFDKNATVEIDMRPVREIDPDTISIRGDGDGGTNIAAALECLHRKLVPYMEVLQHHRERDSHPVPCVFLFTDGGHTNGPPPQPLAEKIRQLRLGDDPVVIAVSHLTIDQSPENPELAAIATPGCYIIGDPRRLSGFLSPTSNHVVSKIEEIKSLLRQ